MGDAPQQTPESRDGVVMTLARQRLAEIGGKNWPLARASPAARREMAEQLGLIPRADGTYAADIVYVEIETGIQDVTDPLVDCFRRFKPTKETAVLIYLVRS